MRRCNAGCRIKGELLRFDYRDDGEMGRLRQRGGWCQIS